MYKTVITFWYQKKKKKKNRTKLTSRDGEGGGAGWRSSEPVETEVGFGFAEASRWRDDRGRAVEREHVAGGRRRAGQPVEHG